VRVLSIVGPTAVGKTLLVSKLIKEDSSIVIISCDSRKIYRKLDIGTSKPPPSIREFYRMIDIREPDEPFSAQDFANEASKEISLALKEGKFPIVVAGTPLYYKALFFGLFKAPKPVPEIRKRLMDRLRKEGSYKLYEELGRIDREAAKRIHPRDWIRITRALEIYYQTGKPISKLRKEEKVEPLYSSLPVGVIRDRDALRKRINERVEKMIKEGIVEEVRKLLDGGYSPELPSLNAIGYREIVWHFTRGIPLDLAINLIKKRTWRYARMQMNFFKNLGINQWYEIEEDSLTQLIFKKKEELMQETEKLKR